MNIDTKRLVELLEGLSEDKNTDSLPVQQDCREGNLIEVGKFYLFETPIKVFVGQVRRITKIHTELEDSAWVADSGRFYDAIKDGFYKGEAKTQSEIEPIQGYMIIENQAIISIIPWTHGKCSEQK